MHHSRFCAPALMELTMRKFAIFLSLLSLLAMCFSLGLGQGRPRRVGQTTTTAEPAITMPTQTPSKPPVLGGANYPNNRKPEAQQEQTPTGPEEVDAGDVIKVSTSLV